MPGQVITVTGPVEVTRLGITDAHNHVWVDPPAGAAPDAPVLRDLAAISTELEAYRVAGGSAQVDCQPGGCGRNGNRLRELSVQSGVLIIGSTGFHLKRYYPPEAMLWEMDAQQATDYFLGEIRQGMLETRSQTPVYPGVIKIAVYEKLADTSRQMLEAAAQACNTSGLAITMHTERGQGVEDYLEFFLGQAVPTERLIFCHIDKRPDLGLHQELAQAGVMLEYDTFYRPKYAPEEHLWPLIAGMAQAGLHSQVALATDLADSSLWHFGGGPGIARFAAEIPARLATMGLDADTIAALTGGNIARRLAV